MIVLFTLGRMLASPFAADLVARLANERRLGAYYGLLNSFGGLGVLMGSTLIGSLLQEGAHGHDAARPWPVAVFLLAFGAMGIAILIAHRIHQGQRQMVAP